MYSYNQKWDEDGEAYYTHQMDIEPSLHKECLQTAKKVIQSIRHTMKESLVHCRVDLPVLFRYRKTMSCLFY